METNDFDLQKEIEESEKLEDVERLEKLNSIAHDLANQFSYDMGILENAIEIAIEEVSDEARKETNYYSIADITQDINVTPSWEQNIEE